MVDHSVAIVDGLHTPPEDLFAKVNVNILMTAIIFCKLTLTGIPCTLLHLGILLDTEDGIPLKNVCAQSCVIQCVQTFVNAKHFI